MKVKKKIGAIVGFGQIAEEIHYPSFLSRNDSEIIAFADISPARLAEIRHKFPNLIGYDSVEKMFSNEQLDFVDIASPPYSHKKIIDLALMRKFHVLCEKPLVATLDEAYAVQALSKKEQTVVYPVLNYKRGSAARAIHHVLRSGKIGTAKHISIDIIRPRHRAGTLSWVPHWRREKKYSCGGVLMDYGPHVLSIVSLLCEDYYPNSISSLISVVDKAWGRTTEDNATIILEINHCRVSINLSWTASKREIVYKVQGTKGVTWARIGDAEHEFVCLPRNFASFVMPIISPPTPTTWLLPKIDDFFHAINTSDLTNELDDAIYGIRLIEDFYKITSQSK